MIQRFYHDDMGYDPELAGRVAEIFADDAAVTSKKMFGGIAFLLDGKLLCGIDEGDLMLRVGESFYEEALTRVGVRKMDFTGKPMKGYVYIDETGFPTDDDLQDWLMRAYDFVETLPKKKPKNKKV